MTEANAAFNANEFVSKNDFANFQNTLDKKFNEFGSKLGSSKEQGLMEVKSSSTDSSMNNFIVSGQTNGLEVKSSFAGGSQVVMSQASEAQINALVQRTSIVRTIASSISIVNDSFEVVYEDINNAASWGTITNDKPVKRKLIRTKELMVQPKATQKFLEDAGTGAESFMHVKIADAFSRAENKAFLTGQGEDMPRGILTYDEQNIERIKKSFDVDAVEALVGSLPDVYLEGAVLLMNRRTEQVIKNLKDARGQFIYQAANATSYATVLGYPIYTTQDMPDAIASQTPIIFANFKYGYQIVDKTNILLTRDELTEKPFVKFYALKKLGGDVINGDAIKILQVA
jgi:HK97 family phage major capsid protein